MINFDICFYHENCPDGILAAYPLWKQNKIVIAVNHQQSYTNVGICKDKNIIIVDFCFTIDTMVMLCNIAKYILVLDHHKSSISIIESLKEYNNLESIIDMNLSGCQLSYKYFYNDTNWLIDIIGDRDLWKFENKDTKVITRAIDEKGYDWSTIDYYVNLKGEDLTKEYNNLLIEGKKLLEYDIKLIDEMVSNSDDYLFYISNSHTKKFYNVRMTGCDINRLVSDVGDRMNSIYHDSDFVVIWRYIPSKDIWKISLRNIKHEIDLSEICSSFYGGGGHKNAAGFTIYGRRHDGYIVDNVDDDKVMAYGCLLDYFIKME